MHSNPITFIAEENHLKPSQVQAVAALLEEGATIPFIARYRKEATGSLDEVVLTVIRDRLLQIEELEQRKTSICKSLEQQGQLNDALKEKIAAASSLAILEDIYLPYKPKRRTRAAVAREKGLEPLAIRIFNQSGIEPPREALKFVNAEKKVADVEEALAGARDIMAEMINENQQAREALRHLFTRKATFQSRVVSGKESEGRNYKDYFDWEESFAGAPSHRILAMQRGEREGVLNVSLLPPSEDAIALLESIFVKGSSDDSRQVQLAVADSYKRLLSRSMETEFRRTAKERADSEAIRIFANNLRQLLMEAPLGAKNVLAIDPGFRTGCKIVCLDPQGALIHHDTIYPHTSDSKRRAAADEIKRLCRRYQIEAIAVGSGTAGRETEAFLREIDLPQTVKIARVSESGASIYSASAIAREEFPDHDLTVRGAVSIGRRLMDPLAELVKLDPKSIGVGQYQHDVDPAALKRALDDVVASCVNRVGIDVNRASVQLLTYVSGLGPSLAANIVAHRNQNGPFKSRKALMAVPRLGPKAFEQSAGFLRVTDGENPLDASAVHPERYPLVTAMAKDLGCSVKDLINQADLRKRINLSAYVGGNVGLPTLQDIIDELAKPGRDPRETFQEFSFAGGVETIEDLQPGMKLPGIVTNITAFGAFVDIGVHQEGLVHISELADRFVKDPATVVSVHQNVMVTVKDVDPVRKRIALSMKTKNAPSSRPKQKRAQEQAKPLPASRSGTNPFNNPFSEAFSKK